MRAEDLHRKEILELDPEGGLIRFAGQRALLLDAAAMGVLRQYLIANFGLTAARAVLTQFGFAHGWRMAGVMKREFVCHGRGCVMPSNADRLNDLRLLRAMQGQKRLECGACR